MGLKYTYETGQITRDFHFKKVDGDCKRDPERTVNIGVMCRTCPFFGGEYKHWIHDDRIYIIKCKYHKKDDPGLSDIVSEMYREFEEEAIAHFYD